jgi:alpha-glucosidase (family GH31 glycosyl hydrolase)
MNADASNTAQTTGAQQKVFISANDGSAAVGSQHGNKVNYPDPTLAATATWWKTQITGFQATYNFDGFWLNQNDLYSECDSFCSPYNIVGKQLPTVNVENSMAYIPGNENLDRNSLDVSAKYSVGTEFDYHNRFPRDQAKITKEAFTDTRPFIISSGSIASQGKFGASFYGDNYSTEEDMKQSVQDLYMSNIYGMPFSGSDVCGFNGVSNA